MALRYYIYGEVGFTTNAKRNAAGRRLDNRAGQAGFSPEVWAALLDAYGTWPAGRADVILTDDNGAPVPGLRFCYATDDQATANAAQEDVAAAWDVADGMPSFWAYATAVM